MPTAARNTQRAYLLKLLLIVAAGVVWRTLLATLMPVIARDGVTFCWFAKRLGAHGWTYLHQPEAAQHPLYPALILLAHQLLSLAGFADRPLVWQAAGQLVSGLAGAAVIPLTAAVAQRIVHRLALPLDKYQVALAAAGLAALTPLNVRLSADAMSDQVHLAFYLAAVWAVLDLTSLRMALTCGLFAGLAFLTRPEGAVPLPAALVALAALHRRRPDRHTLARGAVLLAAFAVCAAPYWAATGTLSKKKDPVDLLEGRPAARLNADVDVVADTGVVLADAADRCTAVVVTSTLLAKLRLQDVPWYQAPLYVAYETFRAGRVVLPLLALMPFLNLRRRLLAPELIGWTACLAGHLALTTLLLTRYDYLQPRHLLVPVALITPLAAMFLARLVGLARQHGRPRLAIAVAVVCLLPLALYSLRLPNGTEGYLRRTAHWLRAHDAALEQRTLLSGSSGRRVAFYADMRWQPWPEQPGDYDVVVDHLRVSTPGYFLIEVGSGYERAGNRELVDRLGRDPAVAPTLRLVHTERLPGGKLLLFELRPPSPTEPVAACSTDGLPRG